MPVVDTNVLILASAGDEASLAALRRAAEDGPLILPAIVVSEYLAGVQDPAKVLRDLHRSFAVAVPDDAFLLRTAALRAGLRGATPRPKWNDIQVAAVALEAGTYVVTRTVGDFKRLGVAAWDGRGRPPLRPA